MVTSREAIDVIANTLKDHSRLSEDISYLTHEADPDGQDAGTPLPMIEFQDVDTERDDPSNSNLVDYLTDADGNRVGYIHETKWEMDLQIDVWTVSGSDYDVDEIGKDVRAILYTYDSRGPAKQFTDRQGEPVPGIYDFSLRDMGREDTLTETPSVRRWRQNARVRGAEQLEIVAEEPPVRGTTNNP